MTVSSGLGTGISVGSFERALVEKEEMVVAKTLLKWVSSPAWEGRYFG